jgi:hypothetical protein
VAKIIDYAARRADPTILEGVSAIRTLAANGFQGDLLEKTHYKRGALL